MATGHIVLGGRALKTASGEGSAADPSVLSVALDASGLAVTADTELTTTDVDTGAGTDTRAVVALVLPASGGGVTAVGGTGAASSAVLRVVAASDSPEVTNTASTATNTGTTATNTGTTATNTGNSATALQIIDDWDKTDACKSVAIQASVTGTVNGANAVAAAGDYAAGDIMSQSASNGVGLPWKFTGLCRGSAYTCTVVGGNIATSVEGFVPRIRLWLFNGQPTTATELDDNAAMAIDLDDRTKLQLGGGYIDFPAMVDVGEFSFAQVSGLSQMLYGDANGDVWGIVQLLDAVTNESAGMSVWPTLHVIQD